MPPVLASRAPSCSWRCSSLWLCRASRSNGSGSRMSVTLSLHHALRTIRAGVMCGLPCPEGQCAQQRCASSDRAVSTTRRQISTKPSGAPEQTTMQAKRACARSRRATAPAGSCSASISTSTTRVARGDRGSSVPAAAPRVAARRGPRPRRSVRALTAGALRQSRR